MGLTTVMITPLALIWQKVTAAAAIEDSLEMERNVMVSLQQLLFENFLSSRQMSLR